VSNWLRAIRLACLIELPLLALLILLEARPELPNLGRLLEKSWFLITFSQFRSATL
jgi:hypothetical protein